MLFLCNVLDCVVYIFEFSVFFFYFFNLRRAQQSVWSQALAKILYTRDTIFGERLRAPANADHEHLLISNLL